MPDRRESGRHGRNQGCCIVSDFQERRSLEAPLFRGRSGGSVSQRRAGRGSGIASSALALAGRIENVRSAGRRSCRARRNRPRETPPRHVRPLHLRKTIRTGRISTCSPPLPSWRGSGRWRNGSRLRRPFELPSAIGDGPDRKHQATRRLLDFDDDDDLDDFDDIGDIDDVAPPAAGRAGILFPGDRPGGCLIARRSRRPLAPARQSDCQRRAIEPRKARPNARTDDSHEPSRPAVADRPDDLQSPSLMRLPSDEVDLPELRSRTSARGAGRRGEHRPAARGCPA